MSYNINDFLLKERNFFMALEKDIILPSWISAGMVFQQGVPLLLHGRTGPDNPVTLDVVKDPTDGRKVSKLDTDYGVIISLETTSDDEGNFHFKLPPYRSSTDAYTLVFRVMTSSLSINDCRCGDVWVMLGGKPLSIPICQTGAPRTPLKKSIMPSIRFFSPKRDCYSDVSAFSYEPILESKEGCWIHVRDTQLLKNVSSAAFSLAYHLSDQLHYSVGIIDLAEEYAPIYRWLSHDGIDENDTIREVLSERGLYFTEEGFHENVKSLLEKKKEVILAKAAAAASIEEEEKEKAKAIERERMLAEKQAKSAEAEKKSSEEDTESTSEDDDVSLDTTDTENTDSMSSSQEDEPLLSFPNDDVVNETVSNVKLFSKFIIGDDPLEEAVPEPLPVVIGADMMSVLYNHMLSPLCDISIRGIVYAPDASDAAFGEKYVPMVRQLLVDLARVFGPRSIDDRAQVPSLILLGLHPNAIDVEKPYQHVEFNERLSAIRRRFPMPIGILSQHDMLLPDKTATFTIGRRLANIALGLHFTPKMPSSSPECDGIEIIGNKVMLSFDNTVDGLRLAENESILRGFSICDERRVYVPASAKILHSVRVMVWNDEIANPVGVMYGYSPIPHQATFKNRIDLPVLPFRIDRVPSVYCSDMTFTDCDMLTFVGKEKWEDEFTTLPVYRVTKGKADIVLEDMNKTQGSSSLHIKYDTENSLLSFGPVLSDASSLTPLDLSYSKGIAVDIFNPDQAEKTLQISGFSGSANIEIGLRWQTIMLPFQSEKAKQLESMTFTLFDTSRSGEIYVDNIRFLANGFDDK